MHVSIQDLCTIENKHSCVDMTLKRLKKLYFIVSFKVTHPFSQFMKTSERVNTAGDQCMAITLMQYFIAIER